MKKVLMIILFLVMVLNLGFASKAYTLVDLKTSNGGNVTYRGSITKVQIPDVYESEESDFRGAWVTPFVGDIDSFRGEWAWKTEVAEVIKIFKEYNLNAMIFHVRTHNNALYDSELNPLASWFAMANFHSFDPLKYLIDECHKAGIEFHAWMNPYRITTNTTNIDEAVKNGQYLAGRMPVKNPARYAGNLISGDTGVILNPGLPNVRDFIVDTCMEVVEKYDVDAIHFDDYFYIKNAQDSDTYRQYNPKKLSLADWRREQVNLFIEALHKELTAFNKANNKAVQLGISPSGIYKNGNGSIESGSNTAGFAHYGDYLYSDTYKWAKEGWIDYLLPQSYWAFEHPIAGYADVMSWWNKAFEGLDCLLYSGIGVYMADGNNYSWKTNSQEFVNQLKYLMSLENVDGYSIYSFKYVRASYNGDNSKSSNQIRNAKKAGCFGNVALNPEVETMKPIVLEGVADLVVNGNTLTWSHNKEAKSYAIYASTSEITYDKSELVAIVGSVEDTVTWTSPLKGDYKYVVRTISRTNTLSEVTNTKTYTVIFNDKNGNELSKQQVSAGSCAIAPNAPDVYGYEFVGWDKNFDNVTSDLVINPIYKEVGNDYTVIFKDKDGNILKEEQVAAGSSATAPTAPVVEGYKFVGWDKSFDNVTSNLIVNPIYEIVTIIPGTNPDINLNEYTVTFKDKDGNILKEEKVVATLGATAPDAPDVPGYEFIGWDREFDNVTSDLIVTAVYEVATTNSGCKNELVLVVVSLISLSTMALVIFKKER